MKILKGETKYKQPVAGPTEAHLLVHMAAQSDRAVSQKNYPRRNNGTVTATPEAVQFSH